MRSAFALTYLGLGLGCMKPASPSAPVVEAPLFAIRGDAFGPLGAKTPATLAGLRRAFAGYDVVPINNDGLEYRVSREGAKLFEIIPDDTGAILNIHVVTPKLTLGGWRVGEPFRYSAGMTCECWADQTVCFKLGDHFAVGLAKICREGAGPKPGSLRDVSIRVTIWSPRPLAGAKAP